MDRREARLSVVQGLSINVNSPGDYSILCAEALRLFASPTAWAYQRKDLNASWL